MTDLYKRIKALIRPYYRLQLLGVIITILYSLGVFASPLVSKYLIDEVIPARSLDKLSQGVFIFFLICISQPIFALLKDIVFVKITESVTYDIRTKMFGSLLKSNCDTLNTLKSGEVISRIGNDGYQASQFISNIFVILFKNFILIVMILCGMAYISPLLTLVIVVLFSVFFIVNMSLSKKFKSMQSQVQKNYDEIYNITGESIDKIDTIMAYQLEDMVVERFKSIIKQTKKDNTQINIYMSFVNNLSTSVMILALCVIYGAGSLLVMEGKATLGDVIALGLYFQLLAQPVFEIMNNNVAVYKTAPIFDRIFEYLELQTEEISDISEPFYPSKLCFEGVSHSYDNKSLALYNINFKLPSSGLVTIIGDSGSGKSTFMKILCGQMHPTSGSIYYNSLKKIDNPQALMRQHSGYVSQTPNFMSFSLHDNLCYRNSSDNATIISKMDELNIFKKISKKDELLNSGIDIKNNFSGGELQRLALVRASLKAPAYYAFDEPTASLDNQNRAATRTFIKKLSRTKPVIVSTHDSNLITESDMILIFKNGEISQYGSHMELSIKSPEYNQLIEKYHATS